MVPSTGQRAGGEDQPAPRVHPEVCGGLKPVHLKHLPTVGGVHPQLLSLGAHWTVPLHCITGVPSPVVQGSGRRGGCALGTGQHTPLLRASQCSQRQANRCRTPAHIGLQKVWQRTSHSRWNLRSWLRTLLAPLRWSEWRTLQPSA